MTLGGSRSSARDASLGSSPFPTFWRTCFASTSTTLRPSLPKSAYLFANPRGNRSLRGRYGPRALHNLVVEAGTSAGVAGRHFPHRWRHSYATSLVRRGEDIHVVQRLMGHSNIATTTSTFTCRTPISSRPSTGRFRKAESARLLGGPHLGVHVEPRLQRFEVGPVGLGEAHVVLLLDRFEQLRRAFQLL